METLTGTFGNALLWLALGLALTQSVTGLRGGLGKTVISARALFAAMSLAFLLLLHAFATCDFSLRSVAENAHSSQPIFYRIAAAWGHHEGSMLLWVWVHALNGAALSLMGRVIPDRLLCATLGWHGALGVLVLLFLAGTSSPFTLISPIPEEGRGFNPLLQDIGLALHPPMLYLGYVGLVSAYCLAMGGLWEKKLDAAWAALTAPWVLASWACLTAGIGLGSWWAYRELGWGGWWFWDPVENASLLPWLAATGLLHSLQVLRTRGALAGWSALLSIAAFAMSLLGTFLVRSGVLTSVHAFANDPERGMFILGILAVSIGAGLTLFALRAPQVASAPLTHPVSREGGILANNLVLLTLLSAVAVGTLYPIAAQLLGEQMISVGPGYFNGVTAPLGLLLLVLAALGVHTSWGSPNPLRKRRIVLGAFAILALLAGAIVTGMPFSAWEAAGYAGGFFLASATLLCWRAAKHAKLIAVLPMLLGHLGLAAFTLGATGMATGQIEIQRNMKPQETLAIGPYTLAYDSVTYHKGPNYFSRVAQMAVRDADGQALGWLSPEARLYPAEGQRTSEAALRSRPLHDLYVVAGSMDDDQRISVRAYFNPLIGWIWAGFTMAALGGGIAAFRDWRGMLR
ncbi:MAG: heme lyase CcmF/NrfE family subunit [Alphaproteobacteria bacterium]|nr:heme lyase CcmF/NrfE family subunit [Alphaproteobacteria bacterium]